MTQTKLAKLLNESLGDLEVKDQTFSCAKCRICLKDSHICYGEDEECIEGIRDWLILKNKGGKRSESSAES